MLTIFGISTVVFRLFLSIFEYQVFPYILFKQRKHKTFNYKPRFSNENQGDSNNNGVSEREGFVDKWKAKNNTNRKVRGVMSFKALIFILVLLLICMYLLEKKYM